MGTETLKIGIELWATMWDKPPQAGLWIDDQNHYNGEIIGTQSKPNIITFEHTFKENTEHCLTIKRGNKLPGQTVVDNDGNVLKDQLLHIKNIEIDDINLGAIVYNGIYYPEYPEPWASQQRSMGVELVESFNNCTSMGFNGDWKLKFTSPFYLWLIDNLY